MAEPTISVTFPIDEQRVRDLMCGAFEGGSNYWVGEVERKGPKFGEYLHEHPFGPDSLIIHSDEDDFEPKTLDRAACIRGLHVMAEKYPRHFGDFVQDNYDAGTSDVYLQCCILGEIIYG